MPFLADVRGRIALQPIGAVSAFDLSAVSQSSPIGISAWKG
jgi:hypothetical protein